MAFDGNGCAHHQVLCVNVCDMGTGIANVAKDTSTDNLELISDWLAQKQNC